jgi:hypothetical protein
MHENNSIARGLSMDTLIGGQEKCADTSREGYEVIYVSLGIAFSMIRTREMIYTWERWRNHIYFAGAHYEPQTQVQRYAQRRTFRVAEMIICFKRKGGYHDKRKNNDTSVEARELLRK